MDNTNEFLIVKNIVFSDGRADHASLTGRICLAISDSNDILIKISGCHSCVTARGIKKRSVTVTYSRLGDNISNEVFSL